MVNGHPLGGVPGRDTHGDIDHFHRQLQRARQQ
jgi:hypothetical protein